MDSDDKNGRLVELILDADEAALREGLSPKQRFIHVLIAVLDKLGIDNIPLMGPSAPPIIEEIRLIHSSLYRPSDIAMGGLHGGVFMFRDIFTRISVPNFFGRPSIDLMALSDLSEEQKKWLSSRPADLGAYLDQCIDIFDFAGGVEGFAEFSEVSPPALDIFLNAGFHLQAAAATLTVAFDFRGAIQSSLVGTELALKGCMAAMGRSDSERRAFGHKFHEMAKEIAAHNPTFDLERVLNAVRRLPQLVENRYSNVQPGRIETGEIAMAAQFIAGEAMRQVTRFSIRSTLRPVLARSYPGI
jgi:hypothetical protein